MNKQQPNGKFISIRFNPIQSDSIRFIAIHCARSPGHPLNFRYVFLIGRLKYHFRRGTTRSALDQVGIRLLDFTHIKCNNIFNTVDSDTILNVISVIFLSNSVEWPNLTNADTDRLIKAADLGDDFRWKLEIFRSGLISAEFRWLQQCAHTAYDTFSLREKQVFKRRCKTISFPLIAEELCISTSSAKTYWRRALGKCAKLWKSSIT